MPATPRKTLFQAFYQNLIRRQSVEEALGNAQRHVLHHHHAIVDSPVADVEHAHEHARARVAWERASSTAPSWAGTQAVVACANVRLERRETFLVRTALKLMRSVEDVAETATAAAEGSGCGFDDYLNGIATLYNVVNEAWRRIQQVING